MNLYRALVKMNMLRKIFTQSNLSAFRGPMIEHLTTKPSEIDGDSTQIQDSFSYSEKRTHVQ